MGQRLNIEIMEKDKTVANCYYHWSAYTSSALATTKKIILALTSNEAIIKEDNIVKKSVLLLQETGASLTKEEYTYAKEILGIDVTDISNGESDRNYGLIAVTEGEINNTRRWSEGDVYINIEEKTVDFRIVWTEDIDEYCQADLLKITRVGYSFDDVLSFEDFLIFADKVNEMMNNNECHFIDSNEQLIGFIE